MKVKPLPFRPRLLDFWKEARGCLSLGLILPVIVFFAVLFSLPWQSEIPSEWWEGARRGLLVGLSIFAAGALTISIFKQWRKNVAESRIAAAECSRLISVALADAAASREAATYGAQWVDRACALYVAPEYVPFWEAADHSETYLRRCCESLASIHRCRLSFGEILGSREHTFSDIDEQVGILFDPRADMSRLAEVVRAANGNPTFAMIRAQRQTMQAVREGFAELAAAVSQLQESLTASLEDLKTSLVSEIQKTTSVQAKILQGIQLIATREAMSGGSTR